ncbi:MAG: amino acid ABC transporter permease [Propionibacteriaceae bacterium]|jgi:cystine transport system permease protein|nr:amino acid ABC transporter permease [Propionibacteriaceae bacterium]
MRFFDVELALRTWWPLVYQAFVATIPLTLLSFSAGFVLAIFVALAKLSKNRIAYALGAAFVSVIRGTPLLVQLYLPFYALPMLTGATVDPYLSAWLALTLNVAGYAGETIRGAILAVPKGQWEAAQSVGMGYILTLRRVVLPQALRIGIPPLSNTFISLVKDTSLVSIVMVTEIMRQAQIIATPTYQFTTVYIVAAVIYWLICTPLSVGQRRLEKFLARTSPVAGVA